MSIDDARRDAARAARAARMGIPEWQLEMSEAVPTSVIDDLVADSRRSWTLEAKPSPEPAHATG